MEFRVISPSGNNRVGNQTASNALKIAKGIANQRNETVSLMLKKKDGWSSRSVEPSQSNPSSLLKKLRKGIRGTVRIVKGRLLINPGGSAAGAGAGGAGGGAGAGSQGGRSSTEVRSPTRTSTSTEAETYGNVTVTGGAGAGANTNVKILKNPSKLLRRGIRGTVSIRNGRLIIKT